MDGAGGTAYGAGKAGGPFDPLAFIKKPQVILRTVSWLFAVIVFGCISSQGWFEDKCAYNNDNNACGFGVAIGVFAFLGLVAFLVLDALFDNISSIKQRKYIVIGDVVFSAAWTFLWFVTFCYLTDAWRKQDDKTPFSKSGVEAAIAFSFFSILTFAGLAALSVMRYRQGASEAFSSQYEPDTVGGQPAPSPYSAYGQNEAADPYQQPFQQGGMDDKRPPPGDFNVPTY